MKRNAKISFVLILFFMKLSVLQAQSVKDADGNIYLAINIGKQIWLAENLKTTKYNDGKTIPLVAVDKEWKALKTPGFCYFENDPANKNIYGVLYNWYTVSTNKLCPKGWHVASHAEWKTMVDFIGGINTAGDKLKEPGNDHWKNALLSPTNDFDFTALPGGTRLYSGSFAEFGNSYAVWWTSTEYSSMASYNWGLHVSSSKIFNGYDSKQSGFSVRCVMD
jgi:uncharacterized protein (TIGR02145 family)